MQKEMITAASKHKTRVKKGTRQSYMPKWYNEECLSARKAIKALVAAGLKHSDEYISAKRRLQKLARVRRRAHKKHTDEKQLENLKCRPRSFWSVAKQRKGRLQISDKAVWLQYGEMLRCEVINPVMLPQLLWLQMVLFDRVEAISKLNNRKACDENGVTAELLKIVAGKAMVDVMVRLFNKIALEGQLPQSWGQSIAISIHKRGCRKHVNNYRMTMINNLFHKVMSKCCELML